MIHTNRWIYLDPDHRKKDGDGKCVRCKKRLTKSKVMVEVSDDGWYVRLSDKSNLFIGKDCWKEIIKEKIPQIVTKDYAKLENHDTH